ncbi:hypothetical protein EON62_04645, partial [archaeon]
MDTQQAPAPPPRRMCRSIPPLSPCLSPRTALVQPAFHRSHREMGDFMGEEAAKFVSNLFKVC